MKLSTLKTPLMFLAILSIPACYVDVDSDSDRNRGSENPSSYANSDDWQKLSLANSCGDGDINHVCSEDDTVEWYPNCVGDECQAVYVKVYYDLEKELEGRRTVIIEAYDNAEFMGESVASVWAKGFNAKPGTKMDTQLFLGTGIYYLRAYVVTPDDLPAPSSYYRLKPTQNKPVGVFGALSDAEQLIVRPMTEKKKYTTVEIHLTHQFGEDIAQVPTTPQVPEPQQPQPQQ
jgi:hypothetical protein